MNDISLNNFKKILVGVLYIGSGLLFVFIAVKLSFFLAPFFFAFIISSLIEPLIRLIMRKTHISRKTASLLSVLIVIVCAGIIAVFIISRLVSEASSIYNSLPEYYSSINNGLGIITDKLNALHFQLPKEMSSDIDSIASSLSSDFVRLLNSIIRVILNTAISIPDAIVFVLVTILSTYFMASDRNKLLNIVYPLIPKNAVAHIQRIKNDMFSALFGYIKAQLILMGITFTQLCIGFSLLGISSPILLSLLISLIDALPILGTGIILIPWSIYCLITGDISLALSIAIIYTVALIVRQIVEPKILSNQTGIHPLLSLLGMYAGLNLLGVWGIIVGPVTVLLINSMLKGGLIKITAKKA